MLPAPTKATRRGVVANRSPRLMKREGGRILKKTTQPRGAVLARSKTGAISVVANGNGAIAPSEPLDCGVRATVRSGAGDLHASLDHGWKRACRASGGSRSGCGWL